MSARLEDGLTARSKPGQSAYMGRQGAFAFVILAVAACTQDVNDPASFTTANSMGTTTDAPGSTGPDVSASGVAEGGGTSSTGAVDTTAADTAADSTVGAEGPVGPCGNGAIDMGEQCDGANLQGFTCMSLGLNSGALACDPMMCTFDTSMCSGPGGGTSG